MKTSSIATLLFAPIIGLSACTTAPPPVRWVKDGATEQDLEKARNECTERALEVREPARRYTHTARGAEFMRCMRDNGWEQTQTEPEEAP